MLKKRIIAVIVVKSGIAVQSIGFRQFLPIGRPEISAEFFDQWGVDEIVLLDIDASRDQRDPDYRMVAKVAENCRVPLAVGGGISSLEHVSLLMKHGADKVVINQGAIKKERLIQKIANKFGDQSVVVSIDSIKDGDQYMVYDHIDRKTIEITPMDLAEKMVSMGAGEVLLTSVNRDGSFMGYDHGLINSVCMAVSVPVIGCGGAGKASDFIELFDTTNAAAAAAANFFNFTEHSITTVKALVRTKAPIRLDSYFDYQGSEFDERGRLLKKDDLVLDGMLYEKIEKEII